MRTLNLFLLAVMTAFIPAIRSQAATDTVAVREAQIPILLERDDNMLFQIRVEAHAGQTLDGISMRFGDNTDMAAVAAVKLYYGGTDGMERSREQHFAPREYIPRNVSGGILAANPSYSVLKSEAEWPQREVKLTGKQSLFPGVNYFWVSLKMNASASLLTKVSAEITSISIDGHEAFIKRVGKVDCHYVAVGVRHGGDDGVASYRIPGIATSNLGTLLAVYDVRHNGSQDMQEHIDVGLSRSTDGGQTWEAMRIPLSFGEYGGLPMAQNAVGDPAILVDKQTGTIWIVAAWAHGMGDTRAWWNSKQGMAIGETAQLILTRSDDDGLTWSAPINITSQVKDSSWFFLLQGPGRGISMDNGTIVFACQYIRADRIPCAAILYSSDHGATWHISQPARDNTTEAQVAELDDGTLMLNMRDNRGGSRAVAITHDMGATWQEHESSRSALREPVCMASLISVKACDNATGKDLLLFSNPDNSKHRRDITIKASLDGGRTWEAQNQLLIDSGDGWGYTCLTMIDRETVGILYESSVADITFQAFRLADIIKQAGHGK